MLGPAAPCCEAPSDHVMVAGQTLMLAIWAPAARGCCGTINVQILRNLGPPLIIAGAGPTLTFSRRRRPAIRARAARGDICRLQAERERMIRAGQWMTPPEFPQLPGPAAGGHRLTKPPSAGHGPLAEAEAQAGWLG